jgi:hypothetical protein
MRELRRNQESLRVQARIIFQQARERSHAGQRAPNGLYVLSQTPRGDDAYISRGVAVKVFPWEQHLTGNDLIPTAARATSSMSIGLFLCAI